MDWEDIDVRVLPTWSRNVEGECSFQFSFLDEEEIAQNLFAIVNSDPAAAATASTAIAAATATRDYPVGVI